MSDPQPSVPIEHVPLDRLLAHRAWVRALARRLVADESRADDIEQETWRAAIEHPPRHEASLRAWLSAVVRNAARKLRRSESRRTHHERVAPPADAVRPQHASADLVAEAELNQTVVRAVLDLEEPYRTAVLLRWFDGLQPRDIAARTGVPVETVRTRLRRAHERLRETLDGRFGGERRAWSALVLAWPEPSVPLPGGPPAPPTAPLVPAPLGPLAGVLAMSALKKTVAALVVVALFAGAAWQMADPLGSDRRDERNDRALAADGAGSPRTTARAARAGTTQPAAPADGTAASAAESFVLEVLVRAASGAPIEGATVEAHPALAAGQSLSAAQASAWFAEPPVPSVTARTGADGMAHLRGVPLDRTTRVVARKSGFVAAGTWTQPRDGANPARAEILLVEGMSLVGRVVTSTRRPVAGALVLAGGPADRWVANTGGSPLVARARTDAEGRFALTDLARGEAILWAAFPDGPPVQVAVVLLPALREVELVLPETVTVSGSVRDAETKDPIAGALVAVRGTIADAVVSATALTGADGAWRIPSFPAGEGTIHSVEARADGFVAGDPYERASVPLRPGTDVVVDRTLRRAGVLTGVVRGDGAAVAGAIVTAAWPGEAVTRTTRTRTDASGRYRFADVAPGRVTVVVSAEGWFQEGFEALWKRAVQDGAPPAKATVEVPAKGEATLDVDLSRGRVVTGRVLLPDGAPAPGARVSASVATEWDFDSPWRTQVAHAGTDGSFRITGLAPAPRVAAGASLDAFGSSETVQVPLPPDGDPAPVELRLRAAVPPVRGVVTAPDGVDAGDVWVAWTHSPISGDAAQDAYTWTAATRIPVGADRRFELSGRTSGVAVTLRAMSTRLPPSPPVRVEPDAAPQGADVVLALTPGRNAVGRVLDRDAGTPLAGARVRLVRADALPREAHAGGPEPLAPLVAVTSAAGEFVLRDLTDGTYELRADAPGHLPGSLRFDVPLSASLDLALAPARVLAGRAVLADGRPASGVHVAVSSPDRTYRGTTADAEGRFTLEGLGDGPFALWFGPQAGTRAAGANVIARTIRDVKAGGEPLEYVLEQALAIAGRVVDAKGVGVRSAWVQVTSETPGTAGEPMSAGAMTETDGSFVVRGLRPGRHTVQAGPASASGGAAAVPTVQKGVDAGASGLVLTLGAGLTIDGVVAADGGRSLAGLTVQAGPVDEREMNYAYVMGPGAVIGTDGRFRIEGVVQGRYRLRLLEDLSRPSALQFDDAAAVVEAGATGLRLLATAGSTISGRVTLGPDAPLYNVSVNAVRVGNDRESLHGTSDSDGRFVLLGAKPGATYDLRTSMLGIVQGHAKGVATGASDVRLCCEQGRTAKGRAVDAKGEPAAKVLLWFTADGEESSSSATTDAEGRFEVAGLTDADHRVRFESFVTQPDGTRKREWRDCGTVSPGDDDALLRLSE